MEHVGRRPQLRTCSHSVSVGIHSTTKVRKQAKMLVPKHNNLHAERFLYLEGDNIPPSLVCIR